MEYGGERKSGSRIVKVKGDTSLPFLPSRPSPSTETTAIICSFPNPIHEGPTQECQKK